jgi:hypothetical protein
MKGNQGGSSDRPAKRPGRSQTTARSGEHAGKRTGGAVTGGVAVTGCYGGPLVVARSSMVAGRAIRRSSTGVDQRVERHAVVSGIEPTLAGLHPGAAVALVVLARRRSSGWLACNALAECVGSAVRTMSIAFSAQPWQQLHQPRRVEPVQRSRRSCQLDHMSRGEVTCSSAQSTTTGLNRSPSRRNPVRRSNEPAPTSTAATCTTRCGH